MRNAILDAAERRARRGGYNGFSFRDLAEDVDIKSASVHYHFPTKENLVTELAQRYIERVRIALGDPAALAPRAAIKRLAELFLRANETDDQMCLCGILGAEAGGLPKQVLPKVAAFFDLTTRWLEVALRSAGKGKPKAVEVVAALEGALLIARAKQEPAILRSVVAALLARAGGAVY